MKADTADWPITLRISAQAVTLAEALYVSRCMVYGPLDYPPFTELAMSARRPYIEQATFLLRSFGAVNRQTHVIQRGAGK